MAQVRISIADLNGTTWKIKGDPSDNFKKFTSKREVWYQKDGSLLFSYPYYLTDKPITSPERSAFDYSKVGKGTKGCYIMSINDKVGTTYCFRIKYFDKSAGIMETRLITDRIIGISYDTTYILIK
ncbi:MAG: hypothetical protein K2H16_02745 [Prevotella sp.]|nr:hypothetical protein [Prevotella sp.]MDE6151828.1 hypothetical protein [Prevotella sp.]